MITTRCSVCGRPGIPLLYSTACDWCDGRSTAPLDRGFIVWRGPGRNEYVFRTREDAERWRAAQSDLESCPIRPVLSENPFRWRASTGTITGIELADKLFQIFEDRRFPPAPQRAFVAA